MMPDAMGIKIYVCYVVRGRLEGSVTANIGWYDVVSILHIGNHVVSILHGIKVALRIDIMGRSLISVQNHDWRFM